MNFFTEYQKGQSGGNEGLYMGDGLSNISLKINGVQRSRIYVVASPPKTGKSTFVDDGFVMAPYDYALANNKNVVWKYYSLEIDRVSKEYDFATRYLHTDYGITHVTLTDGQTKNGIGEIPLDPDYLRGRIMDDNNKLIKVKDNIKEVLIETYQKRIIPIFGEYSLDGRRMSFGKVDVITRKNTPKGIARELIAYAETIGVVKRALVNGKEEIVDFKLHDPDMFVIIVIDHIRKVIPEKGQTLKQAVDEMSAILVELRNIFGFTFIPVVHTNRNLANIERLKFTKDEIFPQSEDIKETGNLSEDANYIFTMFNPNDDRYGLTKHFNVDLLDKQGRSLHPNMRTIHLVESRHCFYPQHFKVDMYGGLKTFGQITI